MTRDLSQKQLEKRLAKFDIVQPSIPFMDYYDVPTNKGLVGICASNAGPRRRDQLAYLLNEQARWNAKKATA